MGKIQLSDKEVISMFDSSNIPVVYRDKSKNLTTCGERGIKVSGQFTQIRSDLRRGKGKVMFEEDENVFFYLVRQLCLTGVGVRYMSILDLIHSIRDGEQHDYSDYKVIAIDGVFPERTCPEFHSDTLEWTLKSWLRKNGQNLLFLSDGQNCIDWTTSRFRTYLADNTLEFV